MVLLQGLTIVLYTMKSVYTVIFFKIRISEIKIPTVCILFYIESIFLCMYKKTQELAGACLHLYN